jgi:transposase
MHRRWLSGLHFAQEAHHIVLEDYIATVDAAKARRDRLTVQIEQRLADWALDPVVQAMQALRGIALVAAATIVAELGDISRFSKAEQFMSYLGLVPSESSSGGVKQQTGPWPGRPRHARHRVARTS